VSTVPAAVSVFVTGSFEIGIRVDERVVFAGHFAVGFAPARHVLFVLSDVLCAIAEDAMMAANATATPVTHRPLLRILIFLPSILLRQLHLTTAKPPVAGPAQTGRRRAS
jgi:hypothetical protein